MMKPMPLMPLEAELRTTGLAGVGLAEERAA